VATNRSVVVYSTPTCGPCKAAKAFLDTAPDDLYIGIVTFANDVTVALAMFE